MKLISFLFFYACCLFLYAGNELPFPYTFPEPPAVGKSVFVSYRDEWPRQDFRGGVFLDIDLAPQMPFKTELFHVTPGTLMQFLPGERILLIPPDSERGNRQHLMVQFGGKKILFKPDLLFDGRQEFQSTNFPGHRICRDGNYLLLQNLHSQLEYAMENFIGSDWRIAELRFINNKKYAVKFLYNDTNKMEAAILPNGEKFTIHYNKEGLPATFRDPDGAQSDFEWDSRGYLKNIKTFIDKKHPFHPAFSNAEYRGKSRVLLRNLRFECDAEGRLLRLQTSSGEKFTAEYRMDENKKEKSRYFSGILTYPDKSRRYKKSTWINNKIFREEGFVFTDKSGKETFKPEKELVAEKINNIYLTTSVKKNGIEVNRYSYDGKTPIPGVRTDALGQTTDISFDSNGFFSSQTDDDSSWISSGNEYDKDGNLVRDTQGTEYRYNSIGQLLECEKNGLITHYVYNEKGFPCKTVFPGGQVHEFTWDDNFRLKTYKNIDGVRTEYEYAGNFPVLIRRNWLSPDGKLVKPGFFAYTPSGYPYLYKDSFTGYKIYEFKGDEITQMNTPENNMTVIYVYDAMRRKIQEKTENTVRSFRYDEQGRLREEVSTGEKNYKKQYNARGQLFRTSYEDGSWCQYHYDILGRLQKEDYSDQTWTEYQYDSSNRKTSITGTRGENWKFSYTPDGKILEEICVFANGTEKTTKYSYDTFGRKTKIIYPNGESKIYKYEQNTDRILGTIQKDRLIRNWYDDKTGRLVEISECSLAEYLKKESSQERSDFLKEKILYKVKYDEFGIPLQLEIASKKANEDTAATEISE